MDPQQQIFGLMSMAEDQQQALQAIIAALAAEREALAQERAILAQETARLARLGPEMRKAAHGAVQGLLEQTISGASRVATQSLTEATRPVVDSLQSVMRTADQVEDSMRRASAWFAWKWAAIAAASVACVGIAAYGLLEGYTYRLQSLQEDVAQMNATVAKLERKGGRSIVADCQGRLCIEIAKDQNGPWKNDATGARYVIPRGY